MLESKNNKEEETRRLAAAHYCIETGITHIFRLNGPEGTEEREDEPIKLLEVNEYTVPSGVMPLNFGPAPGSGINFPSVIVEVTPDEFQRIRANQLGLPHGWTIGPLVQKPALTSGE